MPSDPKMLTGSDRAKRLECGGLPALLEPFPTESGSKLHALQTLRARCSPIPIFIVWGAACCMAFDRKVRSALEKVQASHC